MVGELMMIHVMSQAEGRAIFYSFSYFLYIILFFVEHLIQKLD